MSQRKRWSAIEAFANVFVGYWIAVAAQAVILPMFGFHATGSEHMQIAGLFTIVSLVRSYALRRAFNGISVRAQQ